MEDTVCEPTVIPEKHNCCRQPNIVSRVSVLNQSNDGLGGGKGASRHGGSKRNMVVNENYGEEGFLQESNCYFFWLTDKVIYTEDSNSNHH